MLDHLIAAFKYALTGGKTASLVAFLTGIFVTGAFVHFFMLPVFYWPDWVSSGTSQWHGQRIDELEKDKFDLKQEIDGLNDKLEKAQVAEQSSEARISELNGKISDQDTENQQSASEKEEQINEIQAQLNAIKATDIGKLRKENSRLAQENAALKQQNDDFQEAKVSASIHDSFPEYIDISPGTAWVSPDGDISITCASISEGTTAKMRFAADREDYRVEKELAVGESLLVPREQEHIKFVVTEVSTFGIHFRLAWKK